MIKNKLLIDKIKNDYSNDENIQKILSNKQLVEKIIDLTEEIKNNKSSYDINTILSKINIKELNEEIQQSND